MNGNTKSRIINVFLGFLINEYLLKIENVLKR